MNSVFLKKYYNFSLSLFDINPLSYVCAKKNFKLHDIPYNKFKFLKNFYATYKKYKNKKKLKMKKEKRERVSVSLEGEILDCPKFHFIFCLNSLYYSENKMIFDQNINFLFDKLYSNGFLLFNVPFANKYYTATRVLKFTKNELKKYLKRFSIKYYAIGGYSDLDLFSQRSNQYRFHYVVIRKI